MSNVPRFVTVKFIYPNFSHKKQVFFSLMFIYLTLLLFGKASNWQKYTVKPMMAFAFKMILTRTQPCHLFYLVSTLFLHEECKSEQLSQTLGCEYSIYSLAFHTIQKTGNLSSVFPM